MPRRLRSTDLDELFSFEPDKPPKITISRKPRRVTVAYTFEGVNCDFTIPLEDLEATCHRLTTLPVFRHHHLLTRLTDALIEAYISTQGPKARGVQAGREGFLAMVKYAATWTYCFAGVNLESLRGESVYYCKAMMVAREALCKEISKKRIRGNWDKLDGDTQRILLAAWLVFYAFREEWRKHGLLIPISSPLPARAESFYKTYIAPQYVRITDLCQKFPLDPTSNAYLRTVLAPWLPPEALQDTEHEDTASQ